MKKSLLILLVLSFWIAPVLGTDESTTAPAASVDCAQVSTQFTALYNEMRERMSDQQTSEALKREIENQVHLSMLKTARQYLLLRQAQSNNQLDQVITQMGAAANNETRTLLTNFISVNPILEGLDVRANNYEAMKDFHDLLEQLKTTSANNDSEFAITDLDTYLVRYYQTHADDFIVRRDSRNERLDAQTGAGRSQTQAEINVRNAMGSQNYYYFRDETAMIRPFLQEIIDTYGDRADLTAADLNAVRARIEDLEGSSRGTAESIHQNMRTFLNTPGYRDCLSNLSLAEQNDLTPIKRNLCNFRLYLETVTSNENFNDTEALLHFMNANLYPQSGTNKLANFELADVRADLPRGDDPFFADLTCVAADGTLTLGGNLINAKANGTFKIMQGSTELHTQSFSADTNSTAITKGIAQSGLAASTPITMMYDNTVIKTIQLNENKTCDEPEEEEEEIRRCIYGGQQYEESQLPANFTINPPTESESMATCGCTENYVIRPEASDGKPYQCITRPGETGATITCRYRSKDYPVPSNGDSDDDGKCKCDDGYKLKLEREIQIGTDSDQDREEILECVDDENWNSEESENSEQQQQGITPHPLTQPGQQPQQQPVPNKFKYIKRGIF